ncbi:MAG: bifunctional diaminohydroxyphosphoribosylaminopyrimidine deaminase/5-amino-6-(5-phosphoribosylamino)uracil reductase RibD [Bacteroidia bacterium]|nr:bifunctional diaminohydroxyphosphoribosylaminopyrimidine deaminase/5-amino-6-(5-phosphoribosylamino)uracil reductase RibD [Bacteroidia bacterium]
MTDEQYMQRCLQLAAQGLGRTYTNPMVGAVVVHNDTIIGEGYHHKAGEPHAEVNAINSVKNKELLKESTIYVSLEPCAHYGKTPPCADLIIRMGIPRVVVGCVDSFSKVAGEGIKRIRNAGSEVIVGVLEKECRNLNRRFFCYHEKHRPYIILKWAQSADGFISLPDRSPVWLTDEVAKRAVHKQRSEEMAILIGSGTANSDNPSLTTREWCGGNPIRVVFSPNETINRDLSIFNDDQVVIVLTDKESRSEGNIKFVQLSPSSSSRTEQICMALFNEGIQSVIVEGGQQTLQTFINDNMWDEAFVYHGSKILHNGISAPIINANNVEFDVKLSSGANHLLAIHRHK